MFGDMRAQHSRYRWLPPLWAWLVFLVLLGLFVAARTWHVYPQVFPEDGTVRLLGVDSWFHVRHAAYSRDHFPELLRNDPAARYPGEGRQEVSGLFNLGMGGVARMAAWFSDDPGLLDRIAAWTPVFLGAVAFLLLFLTGGFLGGAFVGLGACLVFLLFPGTSLDRTLLGFADQHVLEILLMFGSIAGLVACVHVRRAWAPALLAVPFAAFFHSWLGAPLYIVPMALAMLAWAVTGTVQRSDLQPMARNLAVYFGTVAMVQALVILCFPDGVMAWGTDTEFWVTGGMVLMALIPLVYARMTRVLAARMTHPGWPWIQGIAVLVLVGIATWAFFTRTASGQFFWGQVTYIRGAEVAEQGDVGWMDVWRRFGVPGLLAVLALPVVCFLEQDPRRRLLRTMCGAFGLAVVGIWVQTHDFDYAPPILVALLSVLAADTLFRRILGFHRFHRARVRLAVVATLAVAALYPFGLAWPVWATHGHAEVYVRHKKAWFDAMQWMARETPADLDYGVMSLWDDGNFIAYKGERPAVLSRFPDRRDALWLTAPSEQASLEPLCPGCQEDEHVRYAVVTAETASTLYLAKAVAAGRPPALQIVGHWQLGEARVPRVTYGPAYQDALVRRLVLDGGAGLPRYEQVWASPQQAIVFSWNPPASTAMTLRHLPIDEPAGRRLADALSERPVVAFDGGFAYDPAIVPQVMIFRIH